MRSETGTEVVEMTYQVTAELDGRFWLVHVPAIDRFTQARNVGEIESMARELIELMTGDSNAETAVTLILPARVDQHLKQVEAYRALEDQARADAAQELRKAARELRDQKLTLKDVGAVLGVTHQRAHQLIHG
jgi:hypothetical protein